MNATETETLSNYEVILETILSNGAHLGWIIIKALLVFLVGRVVVALLNRLTRKILERRKIDPSVKSFVGSLVNITLIVLLIVAVIGALGIQTASFAALIASAGVTIGMALSGNLSNFAGGVIILLFKPFKVGDYITALGTSGTVIEIQIFHTILNTSDNIRVFIPNGSLSSGIVTNYNTRKRRVEWIIGIDYGEDFGKVQSTLLKILEKEERLLPTPEPFIALKQLDSSSVNIVVRVWVKASDYWGVYFDTNKAIYETFNAEGINFPFPQLTVHTS